MAPPGKSQKSSGIPPKGPETRAKKAELAEKLQQIEKDAESGKLSGAKLETARAQINEPEPTNSEQEVEPHSKPPFNAQDVSPVSNHLNGDGENEPVEPNDTPMDTSADVTRPVKNMVPDPAEGFDDRSLIVRFNKLATTNGQRGGQPEAWCKRGTSRKVIIRLGPPEAVKYVFRSAKGYNLRNLPEASYSASRITQIWDVDEHGNRHRRYTAENIDGIIGVAIQERADPDREYKNAPTTYLKVVFVNIWEEDQHKLTNGLAWIPKADLDPLYEDEEIMAVINTVWDQQEERYNQHEKEAGGDDFDRLPSVCPLEVFKREKRSRTRSASPRTSLENARPWSGAKRGATATPTKLNKIMRESSDRDVKQEPEEDSLFVQQPKETGEPPLSSTVADLPSDAQKAEKREPLRFNKWTYIAELRRSEKWDTMSEKEKAKRMAKALARYHHYREERLRMGDIEEPDDDDEEEEIQKT
ncbi:uncharacterized protein N7458_002548 [Penicillium daleae]|uniref:Uncharacterized protein n=1 Tax=Penicillium daleae TaxID=63821 RepID=A0AAD6CCY2_9EURO|nr:uncharacterized protein N7458_002548 [Penicillium daleae]KAJ5460996.1 hypothetical protein N7458_002548 [Penicillium daleae]